MDDTAQTLAVGTIAMGLLGGLALFLTGMEQMSTALKAVAGESMRKVLANLTRNRFMAAFTGAFVTAVIQSSSVTTVLVVGFISAGIMTLGQSVGVIMGANVGTTITAQIVAFNVTQYALLLVAVGFGLHFFVKKEKVQQYGAMIMGLGLIFLLGMLVAAAFTALVQSSSATTGIVIVLASQGFITLEAGIALAFGANVGTCVTALLATLGKPRTAVQAAAVHVLFNVLGVLLWIFFIDDLASAVRNFSATYPDLEGAERLAAETPRQIANAHTLFNLANTFVFIWFTAPMAALVQWLVPERPSVVPERAQPIYLDEVYFETPEIALERVRLELVRLADEVQETMDEAMTVVGSGTQQTLDEIVAWNTDSTRLYEAIVAYLARLSRLELGSMRTTQLAHLVSVANVIDNVGDTVATNLVGLGRERLEARVELSAATVEAFGPMRDAVRDAFRKAVDSVRNQDVEVADEVIAMKGKVKTLARDLKVHLGQRITAAGPDRVTAYRIESDAVEILHRLYYFSRRIAKAVVEVASASDQEGDHSAKPGVLDPSLTQTQETEAGSR
jgi:phosphate:Na+ symporter